ncbi:MAG: GNAT family N-acetyltransferase [Ignavibacteria bacterium]|nr:GNAT family N-acetyltransferase [Ignavibacteria bacterium]
MKLNLRKARIDDAEKLEELQQTLVKYERKFDSGIPSKGNVYYYDIIKLIRNKKTHFIVAENDNEIIGCGFGQVRKNFDWVKDDKMGYIGLMVIKEKYRRNDAGRLIIENLTSWFREEKISHIILETYCKNINAVSAYRKYGFQDFVLQMKYKPD